MTPYTDTNQHLVAQPTIFSPTRLFSVLLCTLIGVYLSPALAGTPAARPELQFKNKALNAWTVVVDVTTTLPDGAWIGASLRHSAARAGDPALGTRLWKAKVQGQRARLILDERQATSALPAGPYNLYVFYASFWSENTAAASLGYRKDLHVTGIVTLKGDGLPYRDVVEAIRKRERLDLGWGALRQWTLQSTLRQYGPGQPVRRSNPSPGEHTYYFPRLDLLLTFGRDGRVLTLQTGPRPR